MILSIHIRTTYADDDLFTLQVGPDGYLYYIDFTYGLTNYIGRIRDGSLGFSPPPSEEPPTEPPPIPHYVHIAETCLDPAAMPELVWEVKENGEYYGELHLDAAEVVVPSLGSMRTRVFNGLLPGPVIRMRPCGIYHLTYFNDLQEWPPGKPCEGANGECEPNYTGLHLHGLHVSPNPPDDSQTVSMAPGESFEYIYTVPCDHAGGTHWYHTHHHGSSSSQTNGGTEGILVIEENKYVSEADIPDVIGNMPEVFINLLQFDPEKLKISKAITQDALSETTIEADTYLINGCKRMDVTLAANEWTRFRMLHVGYMSNAVVTIPEPCEGQLLAKDGVYLGTVPRNIDSSGVLFFTLASRLDVAIRCPILEEGVVPWTIRRVDDVTPSVIGNLIVVDSNIVSQEIPTWNPCRPGYLTDVWDIPESEVVELRSVGARGVAINEQIFSGFENYIFSMNLGVVQEFSTTGTDTHPLHMHVSHVQLGNMTANDNSMAVAPNWNQQGDWVDTWSIPGRAFVRFRPERFVGPYLLHCHIPVHADQGMVSVINVMDNGDGTGQSSLGNPDILNWGTCQPTELPWLCEANASNLGMPYNDTQLNIPGTIEAEYYNDGGEDIGFHNIPDPFVDPSDFRRDEDANAPECYEERSIAVSNIHGTVNVLDHKTIGDIKDTEWLRYNVEVLQQGTYSCTFNFIDFDDNVSIHIYSNVRSCPAKGGSCESAGLLAMAHNSEFSHRGTGTDGVGDNYLTRQSIDLGVGNTSFVICFDSDTDARFNYFTLALVGSGSTPMPSTTPSLQPTTEPPTTEPPTFENSTELGGNGAVRIGGLTTFMACVVMLTSIASLVL